MIILNARTGDECWHYC
ncbi:hypothetical protein [Vibrio sp. 03_296]